MVVVVHGGGGRGVLHGGSHCQVSILRNKNDALSNSRNCPVPCHIQTMRVSILP